MSTNCMGFGQTGLCLHERTVLWAVSYSPPVVSSVSKSPSFSVYHVFKLILLAVMWRANAAPDEDVTAKINTLMVPFCFEIWIYYKWVPDKQTHGWLPPQTSSEARGAYTETMPQQIIKGNSKSYACHVPSPYPSAWKSCFKRAGQNIHIRGFDMELLTPL